MGSILAETTSAEKVEHVIKPVKDLFGAVFFVSVGMLIDPQAIVEYKWPVIIVTLLTLVGKFFSTTLGAILSGQPLKQSIQVGMSMAQIGEFAFIVATLGLSLGVISDFLFPVAVGASAITTFTTPYLIRASEPFYRIIERVLPNRVIAAINNYSSSTQNIRATGNWNTVLKSYLNIALTNGIVLLALVFLSLNLLVPFLAEHVENPTVASILTLVLSLGVGAPFLWALIAKRPDSMAYRELWLDRKFSHGPLLVLEVSRFFIGLLLLGFLVDRLFSAKAAILIAVPAAVIILYLFSRRLQTFYHRIESRFIRNLNAREIAESENTSLESNVIRKNADIQLDLAPWSAYILDLEVNPHADYIGKPLVELMWREKYGINIAYIKRGEKLIHAPGRNNKLLPYDHAGIIATDEQMKAFKPVFDSVESIEALQTRIEDIVLQKIVVDEYNRLKGLSIRDSGIRERTDGLVIGIERGNTRILNPESSTVFEWNDAVWIVGDRKKIHLLLNKK